MTAVSSSGHPSHLRPLSSAVLIQLTTWSSSHNILITQAPAPEPSFLSAAFKVKLKC